MPDEGLSAGLEQVRPKPAGAAVLNDGLPAVGAAGLEALREGIHAADVIIIIIIIIMGF
jgi:hypothetical protein